MSNITIESKGRVLRRSSGCGKFLDEELECGNQDSCESSGCQMLSHGNSSVSRFGS